MKFSNVGVICFMLALLLCISACKREERNYRVQAPAANRIYATSLSPLHPGGGSSEQPVHNELEENAYALSQGKRLFQAYNCVGCHSHGFMGVGRIKFSRQLWKAVRTECLRSAAKLWINRSGKLSLTYEA
jgi:hypothetical protein